MPHEKSETVEMDGRHYVVVGVGKKKGQILGPVEGFDTEEQATSYAKQRSANTNLRSDRNRSEIAYQGKKKKK